jgi:hypothetical protein
MWENENKYYAEGGEKKKKTIPGFFFPFTGIHTFGMLLVSILLVSN